MSRAIERDLQDEVYCEGACDVICELGPAGARFVPTLISELSAHLDYWDFCWAGVDALGKIGPAAYAAKPLLESFLKHESPLVQRRAERAKAA